MSYSPLFEVTRGRVVESLHFGALAVTDREGRLVAWAGDPSTVTYLRSSAKPLQALPLVESGAAERFGLTDRELAVVCASHAGTDEHVRVVASLQAKAGVTEADLLCGVHAPYDRETAQRLEAQGFAPTPNRHNCSGKHSGMLALARHLDAPLEEYVRVDHPVQQRILQAVAGMAGMEAAAVEIGIDGCSAPNFALPLRAAATAFARLSDPSGLPNARARACDRVRAAMTAHPDMVAGEGRFDTRLMEVGGGSLISKSGAEGYLAVGLLPGATGEGSPALGVAIKISDGNLGHRALAPVGLEVLRSLGALKGDELERLEEFGPRPVNNYRGLSVGVARTCFELQWAGT